MVVYAEVRQPVLGGPAARPRRHHDQGGGLAPAQIAALALGGLERHEHALGEIALGRAEGRDHRVGDGRRAP